MVGEEPSVAPANRLWEAGISASQTRCAISNVEQPIGTDVLFGELLLFPTDTGDAWLLDRSDRLATRLARDGEAEGVHIEDTDTSFIIGWKGHYRIDGPAFIYSDRESGRVVTILGYPTDKITRAA